jgi:hypothetical protein
MGMSRRQTEDLLWRELGSRFQEEPTTERWRRICHGPFKHIRKRDTEDSPILPS